MGDDGEVSKHFTKASVGLKDLWVLFIDLLGIDLGSRLWKPDILGELKVLKEEDSVNAGLAAVSSWEQAMRYKKLELGKI